MATTRIQLSETRSFTVYADDPDYYVIEWWLDTLRHRTDGPAVEWPDGSKEWWLNGQRHRTDGPAILFPDGSGEWWVEGKQVDQLTMWLLVGKSAV